MPYESQSAKVKLGPLTCHPLPENERYAIKDQIISIKKNITKTKNCKILVNTTNIP